MRLMVSPTRGKNFSISLVALTSGMLFTCCGDAFIGWQCKRASPAKHGQACNVRSALYYSTAPAQGGHSSTTSSANIQLLKPNPR